MPERLPISAVALFTLMVGLLVGVAIPAPADEGELLRAIKSDVFDQRWEAVLGLCDQLIGQHPKSQALPRAFYYRAQAFEHIKGREVEAIGAYGDFLTKFPGETGALKEDAVLSRLTLITRVYLQGNKSFVPTLLAAMDGQGYSKIYAAIQASKLDNLPARTRALPILKTCAGSEPDPELKNECVVALLRIDPKALEGLDSPRTAKAQPRPPAGAVPGEARLIRVEVFDKKKNAVTVKVNLPIAFAELLLESLGDEYKPMIEEHLRQKVPDLAKFWGAIKQGGKQTVLEIDDEDQRIKVWVE